MKEILFILLFSVLFWIFCKLTDEIHDNKKHFFKYDYIVFWILWWLFWWIVITQNSITLSFRLWIIWYWLLLNKIDQIGHWIALLLIIIKISVSWLTQLNFITIFVTLLFQLILKHFISRRIIFKYNLHLMALSLLISLFYHNYSIFFSFLWNNLWYLITKRICNDK